VAGEPPRFTLTSSLPKLPLQSLLRQKIKYKMLMVEVVVKGIKGGGREREREGGRGTVG